MWSWPLPGFIPWILKDTSVGVEHPDPRVKIKPGTILFAAPFQHFVHAVEDGVVESLTPLIIRGDSGLVRYLHTQAIIDVEKGALVKRGQKIGWLSIGLFGIALGALESRGDYINPYPKLLEAWSRVTNRIHRDISSPPTGTIERKALVNWLLEHRIWTYPTTVRMPKEGHDDELFTPIPGSTSSTMNSDGPNFEDRVVDDSSIYECLDEMFVYVDPTTEQIDDDETRNTAFRVWLEPLLWYDRSQEKNELVPDKGWDKWNKWGHSGSEVLETSGRDMEDALVNLALKVKFFYGDGKEFLPDAPHRCSGKFDEQEKWHPGCQDAGDGFCSICGFLIVKEDG